MARQRKCTLITGATSGIGLALAQILSQSHDLIMVGRRPRDQLLLFYNVAPDPVAYVQTDFQDPNKAVMDIKNHLDAAHIDQIDHLIHCAGTGVYQPPQLETLDDITSVMHVNLTLPILLTHQLAPHLARAKGRVSFIGSVAHQGSSNMATYAATKAGLHGLARSLRSEWQGRIDVQIIHPGPTKTKMHREAGYRPGPEEALFLTAHHMAHEIAQMIDTNRSPVTIFAFAKLKSLFRRSCA